LKGIICARPFELNVIEVNKPVLEIGQALIRVKRIGACGTDLHAYEGSQPFLPILVSWAMQFSKA